MTLHLPKPVRPICDANKSWFGKDLLHGLEVVYFATRVLVRATSLRIKLIVKVITFDHLRGEFFVGIVGVVAVWTRDIC